jgi:hypothetical protein
MHIHRYPTPDHSILNIERTEEKLQRNIYPYTHKDPLPFVPQTPKIYNLACGETNIYKTPVLSRFHIGSDMRSVPLSMRIGSLVMRLVHPPMRLVHPTMRLVHLA